MSEEFSDEVVFAVRKAFFEFGFETSLGFNGSRFVDTLLHLLTPVKSMFFPENLDQKLMNFKLFVRYIFAQNTIRNLRGSAFY